MDNYTNRTKLIRRTSNYSQITSREVEFCLQSLEQRNIAHIDNIYWIGQALISNYQ